MPTNAFENAIPAIVAAMAISVLVGVGSWVFDAF